MTVLRLSPGRQARLDLAIREAIDARDVGDPAGYRGRLEQLADLNERVRSEQLAELGYLPATVEGCVAVLHVAARILELIGGKNGTP